MARVDVLHYRHDSTDNGPVRVRKRDWAPDSFEVMERSRWNQFVELATAINGFLPSTLINIVDGDIEEMEREAAESE